MDTDLADPRSYGHRRHLARAFGVKLVSDIPERLCANGLRPLLNAKRRARLDHVRRTGLLFVHVPKNAGMSVSQALYGFQIKHSSVRYYNKVAPGLIGSVPSFALLRDPVDRFVSAYDYGKAGGTDHNNVSLPFRQTYMRFTSVDAALDHIEAARNPYELDHIFRPQSWYIVDRDGAIGVGRLMTIEMLPDFLAGLPDAPALDIPRINGQRRAKTAVTEAQAQRIYRLYKHDALLFSAVSAQARLG